MTTTTKLTTGVRYDVATLACIGWTEGDGSGHEGYNVADYFGVDGAYKGPDVHGIEPVMVTTVDYFGLVVVVPIKPADEGATP